MTHSEHEHGHDHEGHTHSEHGLGGAHNHGGSSGKKELVISFILIAGFMFVEFIGGWISGSLALMSDAGHMLSDAFALGLSLSAVFVAQRQANSRKTYGYKRFEVLAAFFNAITIFLIAIFIFKEAIVRLQHPVPILSGPMFIIAVIGLIINIVVFFILQGGSHAGNLNIKSALLHVLGDMLGSVGVIVSAILIYFFGWYVSDPIISVLVACLIIFSAWKILSESVNILLESVPSHIELDGLKSKITDIDGVEDIHDIHVWSIAPSFVILTAHITVKENTDRDKMLLTLKKLIADNTGVMHTTIQLDSERCKEGSCELH